MRCSRELLQAGRHRRVRLLVALLACAPSALLRADARAPALLASAPDALVLADARPRALLACAPLALVLADARPPALLALAPFALVLVDVCAPALLACSFGACAGRCLPPRTPCIGAFRAGAGRCPPHSLHAPNVLVRLRLAPPHYLHSLIWRWSRQRLRGFLCSAPPRCVGLFAPIRRMQAT